jgi:single-stranded-DNA-specific exonuclease
MKNWNKKAVPREKVKELAEKYGLDPITSSVLIRRGITEGKELLYFLENDTRFMHNPFAFAAMEDAVDRIMQAQEEGEIVLIFGDRDVDGISSTVILFEQLKSMGIDVQWRLPNGNDGYGLSMEAVDDFAAIMGTLIITVDCGISNNEEIAYAASKGIDVIVLDHHNPPETLPAPAIIVDPKCADSLYPFPDISGAAVSFKTSLALRFAKTDWYKQEICLLNAREEENKIIIEAFSVRNLNIQKKFELELTDYPVSISSSRFNDFAAGKYILVWDSKTVLPVLNKAFGNGVEFNAADLREQAAKIIPQVSKLSLLQIKNSSKIAGYIPEENTQLHAFFNIFVTFVNKTLAVKYPEDKKQEEKDLQLVALAALADIMPMKDENRIFLKQGLKSINEGKPRKGLLELLCNARLLGTTINSVKLSWNIVPVLNATGRLGQPELGMYLFLEENDKKRQELAQKIDNLNLQRKELGKEAWLIGIKTAQESINHYGGKLCVIIDENINRGVSGILAGKLVSKFNVPAMAVTFVDDTAIGSMRSCRGLDCPEFLSAMSDIFINFGGHNQAAGFSFEKSKLEEFKMRLEKLYPSIKLFEADSETVEIDAELPPEHLKPDVLKVVDFFEPYGETNPELTFLTQKIPVIKGLKLGKEEPLHLKLELDAGHTKWPAMFFGRADLLDAEFSEKDRIDILYQIQRNEFNGNVRPQILLSDAWKSR